MSEPTMNHDEIRNWAESHHAAPVEVLPRVVDSEPCLLRIMLETQIDAYVNIRRISWDDFFAKFDALGLVFVYDHAVPGYNELLEGKDARSSRYPNFYARTVAN